MRYVTMKIVAFARNQISEMIADVSENKTKRFFIIVVFVFQQIHVSLSRAVLMNNVHL